MRITLLLFVAFISLTSLSCKGHDKCGDCPTFSKKDVIEEKSL